MAWVEQHPTNHSVPPPAMDRATFYQTGLLTAPANLASNTSRDGSYLSRGSCDCQSWHREPAVLCGCQPGVRGSYRETLPVFPVKKQLPMEQGQCKTDNLQFSAYCSNLSYSFHSFSISSYSFCSALEIICQDFPLVNSFPQNHLIYFPAIFNKLTCICNFYTSIESMALTYIIRYIYLY